MYAQSITADVFYIPVGLHLHLSGAATASGKPDLRMLLDVQGTVLNLNHHSLQSRFQIESLCTPAVGTWNKNNRKNNLNIFYI